MDVLGQPYRNFSSNFVELLDYTEAWAHKQGIGWKRFRFHNLRHRHAVDWLKSGRSIYELQHRLGHTVRHRDVRVVREPHRRREGPLADPALELLAVGDAAAQLQEHDGRHGPERAGPPQLHDEGTVRGRDGRQVRVHLVERPGDEVCRTEQRDVRRDGVRLRVPGSDALGAQHGTVRLGDADDDPDPHLPEGPITAAGLREVRFNVAFRGYRAEEVDRLIERLAEQLGEPDAPS